MLWCRAASATSTLHRAVVGFSLILSCLKALDACFYHTTDSTRQCPELGLKGGYGRDVGMCWLVSGQWSLSTLGKYTPNIWLNPPRSSCILGNVGAGNADWVSGSWLTNDQQHSRWHSAALPATFYSFIDVRTERLKVKHILLQVLPGRETFLNKPPHSDTRWIWSIDFSGTS